MVSPVTFGQITPTSVRYTKPGYKRLYQIWLRMEQADMEKYPDLAPSIYKDSTNPQQYLLVIHINGDNSVNYVINAKSIPYTKEQLIQLKDLANKIVVVRENRPINALKKAIDRSISNP